MRRDMAMRGLTVAERTRPMTMIHTLTMDCTCDVSAFPTIKIRR